MKIKLNEKRTYYQVYGFDDIEDLGTELNYFESYDDAINFCDSLDWKSIGYFNDVTLNMKLHIIQIDSVILI